MRTLSLLLIVMLPVGSAAARPTPAEIDARLLPAAVPGPITLPPGDTRFLQIEASFSASKLKRAALDYEAIAVPQALPAGVELVPRAYRYRLQTQGKEVTLRAEIGVFLKPGIQQGGPVAFTAELRERRRPRRTPLVSLPVSFTLKVERTPASFEALEADFWGYRAARAEAAKLRRQLRRQRVRVPKEPGRLPSLRRRSRRQVALLLKLNRSWQRMGVAKRHLIAATQRQRPPIVAAAFGFLSNLDRPEAEFSRLPTSPGTAELPPNAQLTPDPEPEPPKATAPPPPVKEPEPPPPAPEPPPVRRAGDVSYPRPLVLDDPNIGYGAGLRVEWAPRVRLREDASVLAGAAFGEVALSPSLALELSIPYARVSVSSVDPSPGAVFAWGNPRLGAKWRLLLSGWGPRKPALTLRARWGIPLPRAHTIPTTELTAEDYIATLRYPDPHAYTMDKHALSLGGSLAWAWSPYFYSTAQLALQLYAPTPNALDDRSFLATHYGLSGGWQPWGELLSFYVEARGELLFVGGGRGELFAYLGARAHLSPGWEPALWIASPLGPARSANKLQIGLELRFSYDINPPTKKELRAERREEIF